MDHTLTPVTPRPATTDQFGRTGLDGFQISCSCGFVATNTVESNARQEGEDHLSWAKSRKVSRVRPEETHDHFERLTR